ncbi:MAG: recombinase family protein, partial [Bacteroidia bacterium]
MKTKAVIYMRTASVEQNGHNTIKSQEKALEKYCRQNKIKIVNRFKDIGESGSDFKRGGWKGLMKEVKKSKGKINLILVTNYNRFSRSFSASLKMLRKIEKASAKVLLTETNDTLEN